MKETVWTHATWKRHDVFQMESYVYCEFLEPSKWQLSCHCWKGHALDNILVISDYANMWSNILVHNSHIFIAIFRIWGELKTNTISGDIVFFSQKGHTKSKKAYKLLLVFTITRFLLLSVGGCHCQMSVPDLPWARITRDILQPEGFGYTSQKQTRNTSHAQQNKTFPLYFQWTTLILLYQPATSMSPKYLCSFLASFLLA